MCNTRTAVVMIQKESKQSFCDGVCMSTCVCVKCFNPVLVLSANEWRRDELKG